MKNTLIMILASSLTLSLYTTGIVTAVEMEEQNLQEHSTEIQTIEPQIFSVTTTSIGGSVVTANTTTAKVGERVTLSITPETGYFVDSVRVRYGDGKNFTCGYDWVEDVYTFLMPEANVSISVNLERIPSVTYVPTTQITGGGSVILGQINPIASEVVTITTKPEDGFAVSWVYVKDLSGADILCTQIEHGLYQYIQPQSDVNVQVFYYPVQNITEKYSDITQTDWYAAYASYVIEKNLMSGTSEGTFDPEVPTSRAMVALILALASGEAIPVATNQEFTDAALGEWYTNGISWCKERGIVAGYEDGSFGVNDPITKEQMVTILRGYANYKGYDTNIYFPERLSSYVDSPQVSAYAMESFSWALGLNYIQGSGNILDPKAFATRAEFAQILNFFIEANES